MPSPRPMRRQFARSPALPFANRGYQAMGTAIERPSTRSTERVSSVTMTRSARAGQWSIGEVLITRSQQGGLVLPHQTQDTPEFGPTKAAALIEPNGGDAAFRALLAALAL